MIEFRRAEDGFEGGGGCAAVRLIQSLGAGLAAAQVHGCHVEDEGWELGLLHRVVVVRVRHCAPPRAPVSD